MSPRSRDRLELAIRICWLVVLSGVILFFGYHLLARIKTFTTVFIGAIFFAYLIFPIVKWIGRRLSLGSSIAIVYASLVVLIALGFYFIVPAISIDVQQLAHNMPALVRNAQTSLENPSSPLLQHVPLQLRDYAATLPVQIEANLINYASRFVSTVLPVLVSFVAIAALFVVIPVVAAYMLFEAEDLKRTFLGFIPSSRQEKAQAVIADLDRVVGGYLRGQIIVALIVGILITLLLLGLHVQYAVLIGVVAGVLDVIPYVGAIAGWLPAFFIALFTNGVESSLFVTLGIVVIYQLEGHIIAPTIVSRSVELTPLAVILALIAGGELAGLPGLLLAVPVAGVLRVFIIHFRPAPATVAAPALVPKKRSKPLVLRLVELVRERTRKS